ncbi:syntaxin-binding protein 5 isoform X1 [Schistocerca americana]|uniref:syntaxin-binding protein 5 isoform X1 n=1 Tax=Schistocerca americana TaxID=7009 RepID=UPI001F4F5C87|nr:syntaxin-binding protein 5 isoform X1 [Schistocerca americana]
MKKFTFKGVLDGFRSSVSQQTRADQEIVETLRPDNFQVAKTFRHGFPYQPTALAFDPIQHLLAIGTKTGSLRILGRPGVDAHVRHESDAAVLQIQFLVNEGALVTATSDDSLHLWNFRQKRPEVVHSLKFQRERITYIHLPLQSKWLYVGTERGNIHVVNIESFVLSGYVINWNKAIEVSRKTHPGPVVHLSDNPLDASKLLIGFESGQIVLWDLRTRTADIRCQTSEPLKSITWHHEGKQFMCSHTDGSLTTWATRQAPKPVSVSQPHAKTNKDGKLESCKPIQKVEWKTSRTGESYIIFSGGLTYDKAGRSPSITVIHGKTTTVLEMEHNVVDFITLCESPWTSDFQEPYAIVVLLNNDLVVIDLLTTGYPCFENPYPMDIHESPVTCCSYFADCPSDLIPAFYSVGARAKNRTGFSEKEWPLSGGEWSTTSCSYYEIILTGHADGSIKFWDASAGTLQVLYKLKTAKVFEKPKSKSVDGADDDPFAIQLISLCPESRKLCVAGASSHVVLFKFRKQESVSETCALEIPIVYDAAEEEDCSPEYEYPPRPSLTSKHESTDSDNKKGSSGSSTEFATPLKVRQGPQKKPPGFQAHLVCLTPCVNGEQPGQITSLSINSSYGLMAYGTETGIVIIDIVQKTCLLNMASPDLYGSADPYQRVPRSPKRNPGESNSREADERCRSPSTDQVTSSRNTGKCVEPSVLPVDAAISLSSPICKVADDCDVVDNGGTAFGEEKEEEEQEKEKVEEQEKREEDKKHLVPGGYCSDSSSNIVTPDADHSEEAGECSGSEMKEAASPAEQGSGSGNFQTCSEQGRRKSHSWKNFSLKKQLSRVDQKFKNTFSVMPPLTSENNQNSNKEKRSAVFYCSSSSEVLQIPSLPSTEPSPIEPSKENTVLSEGSKVSTKFCDEHCVTSNLSEGSDEQPLPVNQELCTQIVIKSPEDNHFQSTEEIVTKSLETKDVHCSENLFDSIKSNESQDGISNDSHVIEDKVVTKLSRPVDLPLFDSDGKPIRPPRKDSKKKSVDKHEGHFLSVPNIRVHKADHSLHDLRHKDDAGTNQPSLGNLMRRFNKLDSSFSRSRSSSMSSLENISSEAIHCLAFADSYTKKSDPTTSPTLWVGTSLGSVLTITINLPPAGETRLTQPVIVSPCGTIFRLKGCILTMSFLDCNGALIPYSYEAWRDENKDGREKIKTPTKSSSNNRMSPTLGGQQDQFGDRQFVVLTSEKQARVVALPSHNCVYRQQLAETDFVVKAEIISLKDSVCLVCYISNGHITACSLPSLRPLIDIEFLPLPDLSFQTTKQGIVDPMLSIWGQQMFVNEDTDQIARTFCFSNRGHGLYLCSPSEVQKFTVSSEFCASLAEMVGDLFLPHDMPEPPKESFFKGLFGGGSRSLDREELFGEASGRASRSVAKHIPGPSANIQEMGQRVGTVTGEISRAHQLMVERGDKLSQLEEKSARMMSEAENFSQSAHNLMLKYKDKKWYQL